MDRGGRRRKNRPRKRSRHGAAAVARILEALRRGEPAPRMVPDDAQQAGYEARAREQLASEVEGGAEERAIFEDAMREMGDERYLFGGRP